MHKCKIYTPGKEEKAANLMANVTEKLSQKKKEQPSVYSHKQESIKELNSLMNLGKVSAFSKKANQIDTPSPTTSVLEQINEVKILIDDEPDDNDGENNNDDNDGENNNNDNDDNDGNNVDEPTEDGDSSEISTFLDGIK